MRKRSRLQRQHSHRMVVVAVCCDDCERRMKMSEWRRRMKRLEQKAS